MANQNFLIETRSLPALTRSYPCHFTFHVAHPIRSIETRSPPGLLAPTLVILPSISCVPCAPFLVFTSYFLRESTTACDYSAVSQCFHPLPMQQPAREWSRGDASDIDGPSREAEWSFGKNDIEGKVARVATRKRGRDRVSNKRQRLSQNFRSSTTHRSCPR